MAEIRYLVVDVDGTMTDGGIYYDESGNEMKKFNARDAAGFFSAKAAGIEMIVITGRECNATSRRLTELGVDSLYQGIKKKDAFLKEYMWKNGLRKSDIGYIGDEVNDLKAMKLTGFIACPGDSVEEIKNIADYVSPVNGGNGVVRDVVKYLLNEKGLWLKALSNAYEL